MPSGLFSFVSALFISLLTPLFLEYSSVSLSYLILAVPMRECLRKYSCMSSTFPIAIQNGTSFFLDSAATSAQCEFGAKK